MKDDSELIKELIPVLLKYNIATIENCLEYILKNKDNLVEIMNFVNGINTEMKKSKVSIDEVLESKDIEKRNIIKRVYKLLSVKSFSANQLIELWNEYAKPLNKTIEKKITKNELLIEIVKYLDSLDLNEIIEFENQMHLFKSNTKGNTLENWSKIIIKDEPNM